MTVKEVDAVRGLVEAFGRRDASAIHELQDPEFEFRSVLGDLSGASYRAGDVERYFAEIDEQLADWHTEDETYVEVPDGRILVIYRVIGQGRQSGIPLEHEMAMLWTLRDGKLLSGETFPDPSQALREAGLEVLDPMREMAEAIAGGDLRSASRLLDPEVVWEHNPGVGSPEEGTYRGREAVIALFDRIVEPWQYVRAHAEHIRLVDDGRILITGHLHSKHATSEIVVESPYEQELEIRDGVLVRGRMISGGVSIG